MSHLSSPSGGNALDFARADDLGLTPEEVRRRWPHAVEYGPKSEPYWVYADLVDGMEVSES